MRSTRPIEAGPPTIQGSSFRRRIQMFERRAMGSPLRLTVANASRTDALAAWRLVSEEFERAEQAMSRFRESSDLVALNRLAGTGTTVRVDRRLRRALVAAWRAQRVTTGWFDPRVIGDLDRLGYRGADLGGGVTSDRSEPWLALNGRSNAVAIAERVDLGGIGKGLALRWAWHDAWARLSAIDGAGALLEAGGDLVAGGSQPEGTPWLVAVEDPRPRPDVGAESSPAGTPLASADPGAPIAVVSLASGALCTSSVMVHRWTDAAGRIVHHLIDPSTGEPGGEGLLAVTVWGPDPAWTEVWSKTLFLEGGRAIAASARRRGLAAWWVTESGELAMTAGARPRTAWTVFEGYSS